LRKRKNVRIGELSPISVFLSRPPERLTTLPVSEFELVFLFEDILQQYLTALLAHRNIKARRE
jgi:hypothetical protein